MISVPEAKTEVLHEDCHKVERSYTLRYNGIEIEVTPVKPAIGTDRAKKLKPS